jgi:type II secretory pathway component PulK
MRRDERGSALVFALLILLMASALGAAVLERGRGLAAATKHDRTDLAAFYAAEGGIAHARHALARDPAWSGATLRIGTCDVAVTVARAGDTLRVAAVARPGGCLLDVTLRDGRVVTWRQR